MDSRLALILVLAAVSPTARRRDLQDRGRKRQRRFHRHRADRSLRTAARRTRYRRTDQFLRAAAGTDDTAERRTATPRAMSVLLRAARSRFSRRRRDHSRQCRRRPDSGRHRAAAARRPSPAAGVRRRIRPKSRRSIGVFELSNVDRGTHTVGGRVVDRQGNVRDREQSGHVQPHARRAGSAGPHTHASLSRSPTRSGLTTDPSLALI